MGYKLLQQIDEINSKFAEARDEIEDAAEDAETVSTRLAQTISTLTLTLTALDGVAHDLLVNLFALTFSRACVTQFHVRKQ